MKDRNQLIQEDYVGTPDYPWKVLVICQCLNRANWMVAETVIAQIFERWPTPEDCSLLYRTYEKGTEWSTEAYNLLRPLGFGLTRVHRLTDMSLEYLRAEKDYDYLEDYPIRAFPGCGNYAADAWDLFVLKRNCTPKDRLLRCYAERSKLWSP